MMLSNITTAISGLCLGYATCYVFLTFFVKGIVLRTLRIHVGWSLGMPGFSLTHAAILLLLSLVLTQTYRVNDRTFSLFLYAGAGIWLLSVIMRNA